MIFFDESGKFTGKDNYFISAILVKTNVNYDNIFSDLVYDYRLKLSRKYRKDMRAVPELKFSDLRHQDKIQFLHLMKKFYESTQFDIHIHITDSEPPVESVKNILKGVRKDGIDRHLYFDLNFFDGWPYDDLKNKSNFVFLKNSKKVSGIQLADLVAGATKEYSKGKEQYLNVIYGLLCKGSRKNLSQALA